MVFSSIIFLWVLLPCILLLYYVSPKPFKNGILTVFSLFFYAMCLYFVQLRIAKVKSLSLSVLYSTFGVIRPLLAALVVHSG